MNNNTTGHYLNILQEQIDLIVCFGDDFELTFANKAFCECFHITVENALKSRFTDWVDDHDVSRIYSMLEELSPESPYCLCEVKDKLIEGVSGETWRLWKLKVNIEKGSGKSSYYAFGANITERKKIEERLFQSEKLYRTVVENQSDLIARLDKDLKILFMNKAYKIYFNVTDEEMVGKPYTILLPEAKRASSTELMHQITFEQPVVKYVVKYAEKNQIEGDLKWQQWLCEGIFDDDGEMVEILSIGRDVSELIHIQDQLQGIKKELELRNIELGNKNVALHELLQQIEIEKKALKENLNQNIETIIAPLIEHYRQTGTDKENRMLDVLESTLEILTSPFGKTLTSAEYRLSPREIEISNLIRSGLSGKEIAEQLCLSFNTVETHRNRIRHKLGISGEKINLVNFLRRLE